MLDRETEVCQEFIAMSHGDIFTYDNHLYVTKISIPSDDYDIICTAHGLNGVATHFSLC